MSTDGTDGIAVVGMAARLPGARDLAEFRANVRAGRESVRRGSPVVVDDPASGRRWVHARGALDDVALFDAGFFGIPRREAEVLDPQHRHLLECAWNAMEDAGYDPFTAPGDVSVYTSAGPNTYHRGRDFGPRSAAERMLIELSNGPDTLPTRISYKLGLTGESVTVQSACSSAAMAVHLACEALRSGRTATALVGAVSIATAGTLAYEHQDGFILSADGSTRAYDRRASGYVEGDGAGALVLRRLADAVADGDHVRAVIRASAANNDGRAKVGYPAPSVEGQARVIVDALARSGVPARSVGMVEGHGTGTQVGDPIEVRALTRAYRESTPDTGFCALGSVKANIGHLCFAAGIAGLIKAVLCVEHAEIPPMALFEDANPEIDFAATPFYVNRELRAWDDTPRRAGVSSFGMGGTNVHLVLEQAPDRAARPAGPGPWPVPLSARDDAALDAVRLRLRGYLAGHPDVAPADLAFTLATGRRPLARRWVAVVRTPAELDDALAAPGPPALPDDDGGWSGPVADWTAGQAVDWAARFAGAGHRRIPLPGYPWQGERLWVGAVPGDGSPGDAALRDGRPGDPAPGDAAPGGVESRDGGPGDGPPGGAPTERDGGGITADELAGFVRSAVADVTGTGDVSAEDDLLAVGCDSVALLEVIARIEHRLSVRLDVADVWDCATVGELADVAWRVRAGAGAAR